MAMGAAGVGDIGGHDMGTKASLPQSPPAHPMGHRMGMMYTTFFWGQRTAIIFTGWPGDRGIMTTLHAVGLDLAYLVMLALMSLNGGVFVAAVVSHALGFLFIRSGFLERRAVRSAAFEQRPSSKV